MSLLSSPRHQHRKFIALVLSLSLAVTGFAAAPARADEDVMKFIAGAALLGIIGAAINDARRDSRSAAPAHPHHLGPRPLPPHVRKYDLPSHCVGYFPRYSKNHTLVGRNCLKRNYRHEQSLPQVCRVTFWNGRRHVTGYKPNCLQQKGYRLVHK